MNKSNLAEFVAHENDLLDRRQFEEWFCLFTDDGVYWVPASQDQVDHLSHVSLFYDDIGTLRTRVTRLAHPQMHSQMPQSATVRILGMPIVDSIDEAAKTATVRSKFMMVEDRIGVPKRIFAGQSEYNLVVSSDGLKIARKKVVLTDCDQSFSSLTIPF